VPPQQEEEKAFVNAGCFTAARRTENRVDEKKKKGSRKRSVEARGDVELAEKHGIVRMGKEKKGQLSRELRKRKSQI